MIGAPTFRLALVRAAGLAAACLLTPTPATADIFVSPFLGVKFKGATNEFDLENGAEKTKPTVGISGVVVSDDGPGIEVEVGYTSRYFEGQAIDLVRRSGVLTISGNVLLALPTKITRESLRPYVVGGLGWVHASAKDFGDLFPLSNDFLGLTVGVGAVGFLTDATGLRFDLRYIKSVSSDDVSTVGQASTARIDFWRATIGFVVR